jgi:hypothetical protein
VTISDSKAVAELTEAAVKDSAAMKQIAYLTMFFLPPTFVAVSAPLGQLLICIKGNLAVSVQYEHQGDQP